MPKKWGKMITLLLGLALLSACGSGNVKNGEAGNTNSSDAAANQKKEPAEVIFYTNNGLTAEGFDQSLGNKLRKKFPDYTIKFIGRVDKSNDLPEMIATKQRFDIYFATIGNFENNVFPLEFQYDMTDLIKKHKVDLNRLDPAIIEGAQRSSGGKLYGLPIETNTLVLYYNKSLFDKFAVPYPKDGITWDEVFDLNRKLTRTEDGISYAGFLHLPVYSMFMNPLSIPTVDQQTEKPTINTNERWKTLFQTLFISPSEASGYKEYLLQAKGNAADQFIKDQRAAMLLYVPGLMVSMKDTMKTMNFDVVSMPSFKDQPGIGGQAYSTYYGITNMAKDKDAAMEVLAYMLSDEIQSGFAKQGSMTVLKNDDIRKLYGQEAELKDKNWKAAYYNKFAPIPYKGPYEVQVASIYAAYGTQVMQGKLDLNTAFRKSEEDALKKIEEFKKR
ncbi:MAG: extracellular solute-binding protein family 1 [Paenibacillus sp.]|nr:extracellular solute-binding protein family 1 [Paenibacillus sp.]